MENATHFVTGPYPKCRRSLPENNALGRRKACSRVELHRARRTTPLPPLAPPSSSGANGRSHSGRRGRRRRVRSPDFHTVRWLFGFRVSRHGTARHHPKWNAGGPRGVLAEAIYPAVAGAAVAGGQRLGCNFPPPVRPVTAVVATTEWKSLPSSSRNSPPLHRSRPEKSPAMPLTFPGRVNYGTERGDRSVLQ